MAHPTHPDDITVSMIVSHVSGRSPRVYTRRMHKRNAKKVESDGKITDMHWKYFQTVVMLPPRGSLSNHVRRRLEIEEEISSSKQYEDYLYESRVEKIGRRKLLWNEEEWAGLREDALNSISSYFGSFNGGSVGWCLTTQFHVRTKNNLHWCEPVISGLDWAPWINEGKIEYDACPVTQYALEFSLEEKEKLLAIDSSLP